MHLFANESSNDYTLEEIKDAVYDVLERYATFDDIHKEHMHMRNWTGNQESLQMKFISQYYYDIPVILRKLCQTCRHFI